MNYVVSTFEPTAVSLSLSCHLTPPSSPPLRHLVLAKTNLLEIYVFTGDDLIKLLATSISGRIVALEKYQPGDVNHDVIFILTERKYFCILSYDERTNSLITRAKGNLTDQVGRSLEQGQRGIIDPEGRMIGMMLYDGDLKVRLRTSLFYSSRCSPSNPMEVSRRRSMFGSKN
jgi:DNA damage-binding protein 1